MRAKTLHTPKKGSKRKERKKKERKNALNNCKERKQTGRERFRLRQIFIESARGNPESEGEGKCIHVQRTRKTNLPSAETY